MFYKIENHWAYHVLGGVVLALELPQILVKNVFCALLQSWQIRTEAINKSAFSQSP